MEKDLKNYSLEELQALVTENAEGLSKKMGTKVYGLLLNTAGFEETDGDWVIGYFKAPTLYQKMTILDRIEIDKTLKGYQLLQSNLIKEHSDERLLDDKNPDNHKIIIGAALTAAAMSIDFSINQVQD